MKTRFLLLAGLMAGLAFSQVSLAQNAGEANTNIDVKSGLVTIGPTAVIFDGTEAKPAHITHPQFDIKAPKIVVGVDKDRRPTGITATRGVQFKVSLTQQGGAPVRVEAKCDNAVLKRGNKSSTLTLREGVDGWFQIGDGARNTLRGKTVEITSQPEAAESLIADIKGDAQGVRLEVPPPANKPKSGTVTLTAQNAIIRKTKDGILADADGGERGVRLEVPPLPKGSGPGGLTLGTVVLTSQRASVKQSDGTARFIGNAHAQSSDGPTKFDVTSSELIVTRNDNGGLDSLRTVGRSTVKLDLPQDTAKPATTTSNNDNPFGRPNYLEIKADAATANLANNSLNFTGAITGFYRLAAKGPAGATPKDYPFSGETAMVSYTPDAGDGASGFNVQVKGRDDAEQAHIVLPGFSIDSF